MAALVLVALQGFAGAREGSTLGFLIVDTRLAMHYGPFEADCPGGFEPTVEENFLATLSPDERERILRPENAEEYANAWKGEFINGPGGENVCQNPKAFLDDPRHPPHRGVQSSVAYGLNLDGTPDGRATPLTCEHPKFDGLNGEPAVDNQLYRAVGCYKSRRGTGESQQQGSELDPFLIELRGVDDLENDRQVEVGIYSLAADDLVLRTPGGAPLPHQSFRVTSNPKWRNETTGRIVNGELRVDHLDRLLLKFRLFTWGAFGEVYSHEFRRVRFKLKLEADGGISGIMGGYRPLWNISTVAYCCRATASTANMDCASEYKTFVQMADGDPDPETGQCTTISAAQRIGGIPAFVIHEGE
ncbi:MAG: hypothetical protein F4Y57_09130 [Acidobacteria bacterium]|nr:hypothetical protein [Acidobacteriota bacterium]